MQLNALCYSRKNKIFPGKTKYFVYLSEDLAPDTDVADAIRRIKRAIEERDAKPEDVDHYRDLLRLSLKLLEMSFSESKSFSWSWLGPDYMAPVLFACLAIVVKWLEERLTRYLMKKFNIRLPSIYSVTMTIRHFL